MLYGPGTGAHLEGLLVNTNRQQYTQLVADTKIDAVRKAITLARVAEYPVDGIVVHPYDWQDMELLKGTDDRYVWVTVPDGGVPRLWRVPVVETTAIRSGTALVGAFSLGAAIWDREDAGVRTSDSHASFFIENQVAVLAEERLALTNYRPEAFVDLTFL